MSEFANRVAAAAKHIRAATAEPVTYRRGDYSVPLQATRAKTSPDVMDDYGTTITATVPDWLIAAADLILNSETEEPEPGDTIEPDAGGVFEVMKVGGEQCFAYSDPGRTQLRIHSKET